MGGWSERVMGQKGFFDVERRLEAISALGDPLETIKKIVPWEDFRTDIEAVTETKPEERKSNAGRKPYDTILKFKIMVLQSLHNLSDDRTEYLIRDRISFMRFLDLELEDPVPDATTIWLFREALAQAGLIDKLFERFGQHLEAEGYIARGGQIIDATIVSVPKQRNTKEENEAIKAGKTPEGWEKQPAKNAQKDRDARWTKRNDESFYGYKNHLGVDKGHKLIRKWDATDAAVHDSQKLARRSARSLQHRQRGVGGQRLPLGADRGEPEGEGLAEPYPPARCTQSSAVRAPEVGEHDALEGARRCRARIRPAAELDGRQDRAHHRHRASEIQDRHDEPRLQHPPAGSARADGSCTRLSVLTGGVRVHRAKHRADASQASKRSPIGDSPWHERCNARSAKTEIAESEYCSRFPRFYHVLESISRGRCGKVSGVGRYPAQKQRPRSRYSLQTESGLALDELLKTIASRGSKVILTFPNHRCSNGLSGHSVHKIATRHFRVTRRTIASRFSTLGGTSDNRGDEAGRAARRYTRELVLILTQI